MPLRLYNTLNKQVEAFRPIDPAHIRFYSCGPTVYDFAHIGNFRSFLFSDVLRRFLESPLCELDSAARLHAGPRRVTHVMNITDVGHMTDDSDADGGGEDKMTEAGRRIAEAKKSGKLPPGVDLDPADPFAVAEFYAQAFVDDSIRLGLKVAIDAKRDPSLMPRATRSIDAMKRVIERLLASGHAYVAGSGHQRAIYFDVRTFAPYGKLSGNTLDDLRSGAGGRVSASNQSGKRHPADFLLWKEDASHMMKWASPTIPAPMPQLGPGYPGWHIECTAMAATRLGGHAESPLDPRELLSLSAPGDSPLIDLHSGGEDNIFPHHECELAQSCCAFNASSQGSFASMWVHARFLQVEGQKMSKSKGNFFTVRDLLAKGHEPAAIRFELIKTHYRSNANFTEQGLKDSKRIVDRWRRIIETGPASPADASEAGAAARDTCRREFAMAMHDDLNVAGAIGAINAWSGSLAAPTRADADLLREFDHVLGVLALERPVAEQTSIGVFIGCAPNPAVLEKLGERLAAKSAKNFARSDAIRAELTALGYQIKDVAGGKVEVRPA
jgi:cysteinyl-tRNA synthetase